MLVHVANNDFAGAFDGVVEDDVSSGANAENDVVAVDFEDLVIDRGVFPADVVDVGSVTNSVDHVE